VTLAFYPQDPLFRYNGYLSLAEFRELTLLRLKKFVSARSCCFGILREAKLRAKAKVRADGILLNLHLLLGNFLT